MYKLCYFEMRWYPLEIRRLVSTHSFPPCSGERCTLDQLKSKVTSTGQMFIEGGGYFGPTSIQSPKSWPNFQGGWGGGGWDFGPTQTWSPKSWPIFHFWEAGILWTPHSSKTWVGYSRNLKHTIFTAQARSCITDSLSHTMCVQTNENQT